MSNHKPLLSKSRFQSGLQCHKRLWLDIHDRDKKSPITDAQQAIFDQGTRVGEIATLRWPDGILVEEDFRHHRAAVVRTRELLTDPDTTAIFEAAFTELDTRVRVDVLARVPNTDRWDLIEVKSSTSHKPVHDSDIAIQALVLNEAGVDLRKKQLLVIDNSYEFDGGEIDPQELLYSVDLTGESDLLQSKVGDQLADLHEMVAQADAPLIEPGRHCSKPYGCDFWDFCTRDKPEHWIFQLPGIRQTQIERFTGDGLDDIATLPASLKLNKRHQQIREVVQSGNPWVSDGLGETLATLSGPIYYLDFETFNPGIPVYAWTSPYERIPFQWSCHIEGGASDLEHLEFLGEGIEKPTREFAETLLESLGDSGSIVVYSSFERSVLRSLAFELEDLRDELLRVADRLWDLMKVVKDNYYHPEFHGSVSIKTVLPAMVPDLSYTDLELRDGASASFAFQSRAEGSLTEEEWHTTSGNLLEYCKRDTLAMVKVLHALQSATGSTR